MSSLGGTTPDLSFDEAGFETQAMAFLAHAVPERPEQQLVWGEGDERLAIFHDTAGDDEQAEVDDAKAWQAQRWDAGFGWIWGPTLHGGAGLPRRVERRYLELEAGFDIPDMSPLRIGLGTVSPGIVVHGSPEQIDRFVVPLHRGEQVACQLFSEPDAGSDLANVRTTGTRDGDSWVLNGQKVWSSNAHLADVGLALVRTDPDGPKHRSLTMFVVPMPTKGVTVRPLRQMTGGASFTEVFFDDAVIDDQYRIGAPGEGWSVAMTALGAERTSVGDRSHSMTSWALAMLTELVRRSEGQVSAVDRHALADLHIQLSVARYHQHRMQAVPEEQLVGPERVVDKLLLTANLRRLGGLAASVLGPRLIADTGEWGTFAWNRWIQGATGMRIGGGTDEVLRSMIAERLLGLPREPRLDKD